MPYPLETRITAADVAVMDARVPRCGDGNNASGDGCRSDCLSNETCIVGDALAGDPEDVNLSLPAGPAGCSPSACGGRG